ncbi:MAG TPA: hypothetical protein VGF22_22620 [Acidimicrobiales bacterium]|jgi:hypothetical protein
MSDDPYADESSGDPSGDQSDPNQGIRDNVVAWANSLVGTVHAHAAGDADETGKHTRVGWETLLQIFQTAAPGVWSDDVVKYYTGHEQGHLPSWCGIFATYCLIQGGASVGTWQMGVGITGVGGVQQTHHPKAGDVGYFDAHQHHCIIASVDGDSIQTVDGNSGMDSEIITHSRSKSDFAGFFTAFG